MLLLRFFDISFSLESAKKSPEQKSPYMKNSLINVTLPQDNPGSSTFCKGLRTLRLYMEYFEVVTLLRKSKKPKQKLA